jgi:plasmid stabilization system protein ParE
MPRGDKDAYTDKQKRQAEHIEEGYEKRGVSKKEAEERAWRTVNAQDGGGKKSGSGRGKNRDTSSSKKGGRKGGSSSSRSAADRSAAAKKGWETRRKKGKG